MTSTKALVLVYLDKISKASVIEPKMASGDT